MSTWARHAQHAAGHDRDQADSEETWVSRADVTVAETLAGWTDECPEIKVTRFLTARPVVEAWSTKVSRPSWLS
jgi:hypothetical protein